MTRSEHRTGDVQVTGGEVEAVGRGQTDEDDIAALLANTVSERGDELGARRTHIVTDHHHAWATIARCDLQNSDEGGAYGVSEIGIQLIGVDAPDVIGLDDLIE